ncbi:MULTISPECIES: glutamyl-tRNA reductase [Vibrio]|uniref:Glutamyl-tRNA reductase n=1 Tax=Vibrio algicola TaxID=2662262 RepID=A0A5Q0TCL7_9VIBR|nr:MULTISPECIES: glutamyl-tRNA reductase [Vibrio]MBD1575005.1 glutamyl-tRNA reductase [Vibrio sp. S11_S32]
MSLLAIGINHNTASVELREKIAFSPDKLSEALAQMAESHAIKSGVIVSTCNRTEIYCDLRKGVSQGYIIDWLLEFHKVDPDALMSCIYSYEEQTAVQHLMRVACGLDSLVLGEPQILGQVKQAYAASVEHKAVNGMTEKLFHKAFSVAKKVRTETAIGGSAVSVAYAACMLAKQIFESMKNITVLLVGAGETIELVAKHLSSTHCKNIIVANRTIERAKLLADQFDGEVITLSEIPEHLSRADIVISSTASPLPIIGKGMVESALKQRKHQPMLLVDIAVPRDIEAQVGDLNDAYLYSVDDLQGIINKNMEQRKVEAIQAEAIVSEESAAYMMWLRSLQAVDSIRDYRQHANEIKDDLLEKSLNTLAAGGNPEKVLRELSNKLTNRLIHQPTRAMQVVAEQGEPEKLTVIRQSLGLDEL